MSGQLVEHQANLRRVGVAPLQRLQLGRELRVATPFGDGHGALSSQWLECDKEVHCATAFVLVIHPCRVPRHRWQRVTDVIEQLIGFLVEAHHRNMRIIGLRVGVQHVFHPPDEVRAYLGDTPALNLPRFEVTFFNVRRTVSSLIVSTTPNVTNRSASNCIVHVARPSGAAEQVSAIKIAVSCAVSFGACLGRGFS